MNEETDMATPVTRGEMKQAFEEWGGAIMRRFDELEQKLEQKLEQRFSAFGAEMRQLVQARDDELKRHIEICLDPFRGADDRLKELERHELPRRVDELDETQLPDRVVRLEDAMWPTMPPLPSKE